MNKLYSILILVISLSVYSQSDRKIKKWINTVEISDKDFYHEIPFDYNASGIVLKVDVGGKVYDYSFDTGGLNMITTKMQGENNFPVLTQINVGSSNKLTSTVNLVMTDTLKIGPLTFTDVGTLVMDVSNSPTISCLNGGLIGASIIEKYIWQIDVLNQKIIVTDELDKLSLKGAIKCKVRLNSRKQPYILIDINGKNREVLFDLGAGYPLELNIRDAIFIDPQRIREVYGSESESVNGVRKDSTYVFNGSSIKIGAAELINKPVFFSTSTRTSMLGCQIIEDYIVTLNFADSELYLTPIKGKAHKEGWETFGYFPVFENDKLIVRMVYQGSSAAREGLLPGDEIKTIDNKTIPCNEYCDCREYFLNFLANNSEQVLTIKRDGIVKRIKIKKQLMF
ncbi:hypothetical protein DVK85_08285 [Flavobacterium arcticum]|uniref:PDZ domain-containing protein n=1 Tax=Flavobacterium arcticum TaxID=1784713 RepID=A0A345HCC6_9FLAO|nr:aspartyl protease family protein [Flavobacterium arcticum]AXG74236.1 hypothetical protein DVK85_08285 [Flavobacterium arcticum]KAF2508177.1 hypothetical protein E0W72_11015 [Flavobacterium arcticum]